MNEEDQSSEASFGLLAKKERTKNGANLLVSGEKNSPGLGNDCGAGRSGQE